MPADDVEVGEVTSFPRSVKLEDDETVVFAWITYESRASRDEVNAKVMADDRMKALMEPAGDIADHRRMDLRRLRGHRRPLRTSR